MDNNNWQQQVSSDYTLSHNWNGLVFFAAVKPANSHKICGGQRTYRAIQYVREDGSIVILGVHSQLSHHQMHE